MELPHGTIEELTDGVFACTPNPGEGTMGVVVTPQVKIAIDTSSYRKFAGMVKDAIDNYSEAPWRYVVTTHCHFDHIGGNQIFPVPIIASRLTEARMLEYTTEWLEGYVKDLVARGLRDEDLYDDPVVVLPDVLFNKELTIRANSLTLEISLLGGHSNDSSAVFIPEVGVLFASDLVFSGRAAATQEADIDIWLKSLETMQQMNPKIVVAGHGPWGGPELLSAQIEELESLNS